jgi:hypothetical protein
VWHSSSSYVVTVFSCFIIWLVPDRYSRNSYSMGFTVKEWRRLLILDLYWCSGHSVLQIRSAPNSMTEQLFYGKTSYRVWIGFSLWAVAGVVIVLFFNPLTPELNSSAQCCLTRFLLGILLLEPCISLIYAWKTNKCNSLYILFWVFPRREI